MTLCNEWIKIDLPFSATKDYFQPFSEVSDRIKHFTEG